MHRPRGDDSARALSAGRGRRVINAARERGFALLIVLWSLVLLTLLATGLTASGRADVQLAINLRTAAVAQAAADGAVYEAAFHLLDPATRWAADGEVRRLDGPGVRVTLRIENEAGKINPNIAPSELLQALLLQVGVEAQRAANLANAIVDWRFPRGVARLASGQPVDYRNAGLTYGPPGSPFESVSEVGAVLGMTPAILARIAPYLSVFTEGEPDPRVASPAVSRALRQATGADPVRTGAMPPPRVVIITATADTAAGSRFVRRAAIKLGATAKEPLVEVLTWGAPGDPPAAGSR